ncbi:hypothetical protein D0864_13730 [Hortaea werneckii]|uniref:peptidylprolyl isomerase n=1 Tax=Hortaea werneckii TaxID=91943 RepID=A0A3M7CV98_HORWE|nr:hypothetical protein D0864_13730 [Hortaea werneckii]
MYPRAGLPLPLLALITTAIAAPKLQIDTTAPASCSRPSKSGDNISVHYRGTLLSDGVLFDESYRRGSPFTFHLGAGEVIAGWDQGLLDMCPGERRNLTIPPELGYGDSGIGPIPGGATLRFETELVDIVGVKQETVSFLSASTATEATFGIATAPPNPSQEAEAKPAETESELTATPLQSADSQKNPEQQPGEQGECRLLGPFALLVQGALGAFAILSLVWKRYRENPKRPWKIWFFDVSKQVVGSILTHVLNLAMSMVGNVDVVNAAANKGSEGSQADAEGRQPNPCSYYLLNLAIDTTIGIPVLYLLLKVLHGLFVHTPLARPKESIKSGHYGQPPRVTWWLKQSVIYFIGLVGMKLFVFFLFAAMPFLPWIGDWALRWANGNEALEITFAMFIFPLVMNAVQYWIIDNFIMDKKKDGEGYEAVEQNDEDDGDANERQRQRADSGESDSSVTQVAEEDGRGKSQVDDAPLKEHRTVPLLLLCSLHADPDPPPPDLGLHRHKIPPLLSQLPLLPLHLSTHLIHNEGPTLAQRPTHLLHHPQPPPHPIRHRHSHSLVQALPCSVCPMCHQAQTPAHHRLARPLQPAGSSTLVLELLPDLARDITQRLVARGHDIGCGRRSDAPGDNNSGGLVDAGVDVRREAPVVVDFEEDADAVVQAGEGDVAWVREEGVGGAAPADQHLVRWCLCCFGRLGRGRPGEALRHLVELFGLLLRLLLL